MTYRAYVALLSMLLTTSALSQDDTAGNEWPREIQIDAGTVVVYQPQPEALNGNLLDARAAVSVELRDGEGAGTRHNQIRLGERLPRLGEKGGHRRLDLEVPVGGAYDLRPPHPGLVPNLELQAIFHQ